jgi:iron complex outermembrane receptor protein
VTWDFSIDYINEDYANLINFRNPNGDGRVAYTILSKRQGIGANRTNSELADVALGNKPNTLSYISNIAIEANEDTTINVITGFRHLQADVMTDGADSLNSGAGNVVLGIPVRIVRGNSTPLASDTTNDLFTQEVKVAGSFGEQIDYVAGFFYMNEKSRTNFVNLTISPTNVTTSVADRTLGNRTDAYAGYVQGDYKFTDKFKATAGIRYTIEQKSVDFQPNPTPVPRANPPFSTTDLRNNGVPTTQEAKVWTPRFALNYQVNDDVLVFASATRGFKSGGWNARANAAQQATTFGPEKIWSYEAGIHSDWLDRRLRVNLNAFYMIDQDFQGAAAFVDPVTNVPTFVTRNFADMKNYGLEAEISAIPLEGLNVYWAVGLQKARYKELSAGTLAQQAQCQALLAQNRPTLGVCGAGVVTLTGGIGIPVRTSPFTSTLGFNYVIPLTDQFELVPSANWTFRKGSWVSAANTPGTFQPNTNVFNAGLTFRNVDAGWSITAECTNCSDETYVTSFITFQYLNEPVRWLVKARYEF